MDDESPKYWLWSTGGLGAGVLLGLISMLSGTPHCSANPTVMTASAVQATLPPVPANLDETQRAQVLRGWYLTTVAGCARCHTPQDILRGPRATEALSGGVAMRSESFGTLYSGNLTPDQTSGLGPIRKSHARFRHAVSGGLSSRGITMHPAAMPWLSLGQVDSEDLHCIHAYLTQIKAVSRALPERGPLEAGLPAGVWMGLGSWSKSL